MICTVPVVEFCRALLFRAALAPIETHVAAAIDAPDASFLLTRSGLDDIYWSLENGRRNDDRDSLTDLAIALLHRLHEEGRIATIPDDTVRDWRARLGRRGESAPESAVIASAMGIDLCSDDVVTWEAWENLKKGIAYTPEIKETSEQSTEVRLVHEPATAPIPAGASGWLWTDGLHHWRSKDFELARERWSRAWDLALRDSDEALLARLTNAFGMSVLQSGDWETAADICAHAASWGHPSHTPMARMNEGLAREVGSDTVGATRAYLEAMGFRHPSYSAKAACYLASVLHTAGSKGAAQMAFRFALLIGDKQEAERALRVASGLGYQLAAAGPPALRGNTREVDGLLSALALGVSTVGVMQQSTAVPARVAESLDASAADVPAFDVREWIVSVDPETPLERRLAEEGKATLSDLRDSTVFLLVDGDVEETTDAFVIRALRLGESNGALAVFTRTEFALAWRLLEGRALNVSIAELRGSDVADHVCEGFWIVINPKTRWMYWIGPEDQSLSQDMPHTKS